MPADEAVALLAALGTVWTPAPDGGLHYSAVVDPYRMAFGTTWRRAWDSNPRGASSTPMRRARRFGGRAGESRRSPERWRAPARPDSSTDSTTAFAGGS